MLTANLSHQMSGCHIRGVQCKAELRKDAFADLNDALLKWQQGPDGKQPLVVTGDMKTAWRPEHRVSLNQTLLRKMARELTKPTTKSF